jgi:hypothetical protein
MFGRSLLPPIFGYELKGPASGGFSNVYRDGGGGGRIGGIDFVVFADGIKTSGGYPQDDNSNLQGFQSNSIAAFDFTQRKGSNYTFQDYGRNQIPDIFVPFFPDEHPDSTAIWPNSNIATIGSGDVGVSFYPVVDRATGPLFKPIYGTGIKITIKDHGPVATRPVKKLFESNEVHYGLFSSLVSNDSFLYMFGSITNTNNNGLRMARVPQASIFDRTTYQYWDGSNWTTIVTSYDDGGKANIFNHSATDLAGNKHGPSSGDIFWSNFYGVYMLIFQAMGIDPTVYMSYSKDLATGWSKSVALFKTPVLENGYNYNIHAYPAYDPTQKVIPMSWTQYRTCKLLSMSREMTTKVAKMILRKEAPFTRHGPRLRFIKLITGSFPQN